MTWDPKPVMTISAPFPAEEYDRQTFALFMKEGWRIAAERQEIIDRAAREQRCFSIDEARAFDALAEEINQKLAALEKTRHRSTELQTIDMTQPPDVQRLAVLRAALLGEIVKAAVTRQQIITVLDAAVNISGFSAQICEEALYNAIGYLCGLGVVSIDLEGNLEATSSAASFLYGDVEQPSKPDRRHLQ